MRLTIAFVVFFTLADSALAADYLLPQRPARRVSRAPNLVFVKPIIFTPDVCSVSPFTDVVATDPYCPWIQRLYLDGVTAGCGSGKYCPDDPLTRRQMAVFLEAAMRGTATWSPWQGLYRQTVVMTPKPGDTPIQNGTALRSLLTGITDATAAKPYLLKIEPGIYDLDDAPLVMKPYVDIEGSGELATTLTRSVGAADYYDSIVDLASNAQLRSLGLSAAGIDMTAIFMPTGSAGSLRDIQIKIDGIDSARGVVAEIAAGTSVDIDGISVDVTASGASAAASALLLQGGRLTNATLNATTGATSNGSWGLVLEGPGSVHVSNVISSTKSELYTVALQVYSGIVADVRDVTLRSEGGSGSFAARAIDAITDVKLTIQDARMTSVGTGPSAWGILNSGGLTGSLTVQDVAIEVSGGSTNNFGIRNTSTPTVLRNCFVKASGGTAGSAIYTGGTASTLTVIGGSYSGQFGALANPSSWQVRVGNAQLDGGVTSAGGSMICFGSYNGSFAAIPAGCI